LQFFAALALDLPWAFVGVNPLPKQAENTTTSKSKDSVISGVSEDAMMFVLDDIDANLR